MTRPSRNTDRLLIEAAKQLIPKTGFTRLKVRDVAKKAGVNLGMFTYHFKTKDRFTEVLLAEVYEEFFKNLQFENTRGADCREQLRNTLFFAARYIRDHRDIIYPLLEEILLGNRHIMAFARKNMTRHIGILVGLITECQKKGLIVKMPLFNVLPVLMGAVFAPVLVLGILRRFQRNGLVSGVMPAMLTTTIMTDAALAQRIDIALKGLSAGASHA
jgi:AcrR family transcriptional regulator